MKSNQRRCSHSGSFFSFVWFTALNSISSQMLTHVVVFFFFFSLSLYLSMLPSWVHTGFSSNRSVVVRSNEMILLLEKNKKDFVRFAENCDPFIACSNRGRFPYIFFSFECDLILICSAWHITVAHSGRLMWHTYTQRVYTHPGNKNVPWPAGVDAVRHVVRLSYIIRSFHIPRSVFFFFIARRTHT